MTSLDPDTRLDVELSAICGRSRFTSDAAPVIAELRKTAGDRVDILARVAGTWSGFYGHDPYVRVLADALAEVEGAEEWIPLGRERYDGGRHSAPVPRRTGPVI